LCTYDAREHRHVEAARHDVTGESKAPEADHSRDVQGQRIVEDREGPVSRVQPYIVRQQLRAESLQRIDVVQLE
jgi:hypothetical protein